MKRLSILLLRIDRICLDKKIDYIVKTNLRQFVWGYLRGYFKDIIWDNIKENLYKKIVSEYPEIDHRIDRI